MAKFKKLDQVYVSQREGLHHVVTVLDNCDENGTIDQNYKIIDRKGAVFEIAEELIWLAKPHIKHHESVLLEAELLVNGDRNEDYGHPLDDFTKTAAFWTTYLQASTKTKIVITPFDVPMMMILLKMSRELNQPKRDNKVDIAGYAETLQMCFDETDKCKDTMKTRCIHDKGLTDYCVECDRINGG